jgi:hypothetical protein
LISRLVVHWLNLPLFLPASPLTSPTSSWLGRWECSVGGWTMTLDATSNLHQDYGALKRSDRIALTHVAEVRRVDGQVFSSEAALNVLYGFQMAFSFALGRWVAPSLPVGFDTRGQRIWEQWASWRCDSFAGFHSWLDTHRSADLREFVVAFMSDWLDVARTDVLRYVAHHLIAANQPRTTTEARIMLVQAAIEYLGWITFVVEQQMSKKAYEKLHASDKLTMLLKASRIPTRIPAQLTDLRAFAAGIKRHPKAHGLPRDGPRTLPPVRNMLVHPTDAGEPYRRKKLVVESWLLSMHYANLLLLSRIGYRGRYQPHPLVGSSTWAHTPVNVPWSRRKT